MEFVLFVCLFVCHLYSFKSVFVPTKLHRSAILRLTDDKGGAVGNEEDTRKKGGRRGEVVCFESAPEVIRDSDGCTKSLSRWYEK
jgi:hypothetical protein